MDQTKDKKVADDEITGDEFLDHHMCDCGSNIDHILEATILSKAIGDAKCHQSAMLILEIAKALIAQDFASALLSKTERTLKDAEKVVEAINESDQQIKKLVAYIVVKYAAEIMGIKGAVQEYIVEAEEAGEGREVDVSELLKSMKGSVH